MAAIVEVLVIVIEEVVPKMRARLETGSTPSFCVGNDVVFGYA